MARQRIALNVAATYGRSVLALACGLFTARWVLASLGPVDYGLWGMILGMAGFVAVVNSLLAGAIGRFLAVHIDEPRPWFRAGLALCLLVGTAVALVACPLGEFAIRHWLTVPPGRTASCVWAWRWSCLGFWVLVVTTPWSAFWTARQLIAELTCYSLATTVANVGIAAWMVSHPGDWLAAYAFAIMLANGAPQVAAAVRGGMKFGECRLQGAWFERGMLSRMGALVRYAGWNTVSTLGWLLSNHGMAMLVNKAFGPVCNGAYAISNSVRGHANTLAQAMQGAFSPVVATAWGNGERGEVCRLALQVGRFSVASVLLFAIPLGLELDAVLKLWLKHPPAGTSVLCGYALAILVANAFSEGLRQAVYASGNLKKITIWCDSLFLFVLPIAALMCWRGAGLWCVGAAYLGVTLVNMLLRVWFAREAVGAHARDWAWRLALPGFAIAGVSFALGLIPRLLMPESFLRVVLTTLACEIVFVPLVLLWVGKLRPRSSSLPPAPRLRRASKPQTSNAYPPAPVVMTVYDRANTLARSLGNLSRCEGLGQREVWLFVDQLREGGWSAEVLRVAASFGDAIPGLRTVKRERNFGVPGNLVAGISEVVNGAGRAIVFEDDVLVSRTFLRYMDEALGTYAGDKRIWCVNGFHSPMLRNPLWGSRSAVYLSPRNMAWGFGVWADRWNAVDFQMAGWQSLVGKLDAAGRDIVPMVERQLRGEIHTWDVQCTVHMAKHGLWAVEPYRSLTKNIGFEGGFHKVNAKSVFAHMRYYDVRPTLGQGVGPDGRMVRQMEWLFFDPRLHVRAWRKFRRGLARLMPLNEEPVG